MGRIRVFVSAVLAGMSIAIGGIVYLSLESRIAGALFFTVGLFMVCSFSFHLFTGKVCYLFHREPGYAIDLPLVWLGNLAGCWLAGFLVGQTRIGGALAEKAAALCRIKQDDSLLSLFILGALCNLLIYVAVEGFGSSSLNPGRYLAMFFGVTVFILCGFEHCVADMFYFSMAGVWSGDVLLRLLVITLGNAVGGVSLPLVRGWLAEAKA